MIVRELVTLLGYKTDESSKKKAQAGFSSIKGQALALSAAVAGIGLVAVGVFTKLVGAVATAGDEIAKSSKQIGVNAQRLQELRFAANLAGASNAELGNGLRLLIKNADDAAKGTGEFAEDFKRLGVKVTDVNGNLKSADRLLLEVSDGMRGLSTDSERTALAQSVLGRSGAKLVPLLNQGSEAIKAQAARANELGEVYDEWLLAKSERLIDAQRELSGAFTGIKITITKVLIPSAIKVVEWLTEVAILSQGPVRRGLKVVSVVFGSIGKAVSLLIKLSEDYIDKITGITGAFKVLAAIAFVAWAVISAPALVMILLLGLLSLAIVAVIEDLERMGEDGEGFFATWITGWQNLVEEVGLYGAALDVLKTSLDAVFGKGMSERIKKFFDEILPAQWIQDLVAGLYAVYRPVVGATPEARATAAATPFYQGGAGADFSVVNNIDTTVNAPAGLDAPRLAAETTARTKAGVDRLMRRTEAALAIRGTRAL